MQRATRSDWKAEHMPLAHHRFTIDRAYTQPEIERITQGLIPRQMEDKWLIFYGSPWLFLHGSWTGYCIYQVRFEAFEGGARTVESRVNRDPEQWRETNADSDRALLGILLNSRAVATCAPRCWIT
jgi:hypothetical protein